MNLLIWGVTAIYFIVAIGKAFTHDWNDCLIFAGYSIANVGVLKVIT